MPVKYGLQISQSLQNKVKKL